MSNPGDLPIRIGMSLDSPGDRVDWLPGLRAHLMLAAPDDAVRREQVASVVDQCRSVGFEIVVIDTARRLGLGDAGGDPLDATWDVELEVNRRAYPAPGSRPSRDPILVVIDSFEDLVDMDPGSGANMTVVRLALLGREIGIRLVLATGRLHRARAVRGYSVLMERCALLMAGPMAYGDISASASPATAGRRAIPERQALMVHDRHTERLDLLAAPALRSL